MYTYNTHPSIYTTTTLWNNSLWKGVCTGTMLLSNHCHHVLSFHAPDYEHANVLFGDSNLFVECYHIIPLHLSSLLSKIQLWNNGFSNFRKRRWADLGGEIWYNGTVLLCNHCHCILQEMLELAKGYNKVCWDEWGRPSN